MEKKKSSRMTLVRQLENEGFRFSELVLTSEGEYAPEDADWNYKDIPHLHHVHALAEALPATIDRDMICSINLQRIFGLWVPITLVNYEYEKDCQVYFTTLLMFALIIETRWEAIGKIHTRVTTTYSIGYPRWLFFAVPLLKWTIRRNYRVLMSEDIPMRTRRGALRKLGYSFKMEGPSYGFPSTTKIMESNLELPPHAERRIVCSYKEALAGQSEALIGDIGLLGFRLVQDGADFLIFTRACPHEGASLDQVICDRGTLRCRWHGRRVSPIGRFTPGHDTEFTQEGYRVQVTGDQLTIERQN